MTLPLRCVCAPLLRGREGEREMERQTEKTESEREGKTETETDRVREREVLNLQNACVGGLCQFCIPHTSMRACDRRHIHSLLRLRRLLVWGRSRRKRNKCNTSQSVCFSQANTNANTTVG